MAEGATKGRLHLGTDFCEAPGGQSDQARLERLRAGMDGISGLSELFKALSDETRCKIVYLLSNEELCVCDIAELVGQSPPAVSHHLRFLRWLRLVKHRKEGKRVYYSLDDHHVVDIILEALQHMRELNGSD